MRTGALPLFKYRREAEILRLEGKVDGDGERDENGKGDVYRDGGRRR
jgi:hypothetical protein